MKKFKHVKPIQGTNIRVEIERLDNNRFEIAVINKKNLEIISLSRFWVSNIDPEYYERLKKSRGKE